MYSYIGTLEQYFIKKNKVLWHCYTECSLMMRWLCKKQLLAFLPVLLWRSNSVYVIFLKKSACENLIFDLNLNFIFEEFIVERMRIHKLMFLHHPILSLSFYLLSYLTIAYLCHLTTIHHHQNIFINFKIRGGSWFMLVLNSIFYTYLIPTWLFYVRFREALCLFKRLFL